MARIIEFPKVHRRYRVPPRLATGATPTQWLFWAVALVVASLAAPLFLLLSLLIGLWPVLWWLLVADVLIQLVRIVFIGGMPALLGWLHLSVLSAIGMLLAVLVNTLARAERASDE